MQVVCPAGSLVVQNASKGCARQIDRFMDTCTASCNAGYQNRSSLFTCAADTLWKGNISCPPIDCGPIDPLIDPVCKYLYIIYVFIIVVESCVVCLS